MESVQREHQCVYLGVNLVKTALFSFVIVALRQLISATECKALCQLAVVNVEPGDFMSTGWYVNESYINWIIIGNKWLRVVSTNLSMIFIDFK